MGQGGEPEVQKLRREIDSLRAQSRFHALERRQLLDRLHVSETRAATLAGDLMLARKDLESRGRRRPR